MADPGPSVGAPSSQETPKSVFCGCIQCPPRLDPVTGVETPQRQCFDCPPEGILLTFNLPSGCFDSSIADPDPEPDQSVEVPYLCSGIYHQVYNGLNTCSSVPEGC